VRATRTPKRDPLGSRLRGSVTIHAPPLDVEPRFGGVPQMRDDFGLRVGGDPHGYMNRHLWRRLLFEARREGGGGSERFASCCTWEMTPRLLICIFLARPLFTECQAAATSSQGAIGRVESLALIHTHTHTHTQILSVTEGLESSFQFSPKAAVRRSSIMVCVCHSLLADWVNCTHAAPLVDPHCLDPQS